MKTLDADKLYEFLTQCAEITRSRGGREIALRIDQARKHYMIPLTSEFLGEAMAALIEVQEKWPSLLPSEQASQAKEYVDAIKQQWFRP